jgi:Xaa-Pro aminopeptidase
MPTTPATEELLRGLAASAFDVTLEDAPALLAEMAGDIDPTDAAARIEAIRAGREASAVRGPAPRERLAALREKMAGASLDGFLVPLADEHQGEFIPPRAQRLAWLTGFGGSAGLAIVLADRAAIFVDGRYTLQVRHQVDTAVFTPHHLIEAPPDRWLAENAGKGMRVGFDPWLHTKAGIDRLRRGCERAGAELVPVDANPLDAAWADQPPPPLGPVVPHADDVAGRSSADKRAEAAATVAEDGADAAVLSAPDSIAWLLNVRGCDVGNTPLPLSYAILHAGGAVEWFVDPRKLPAATREHVGADVSAMEPGAFGDRLDALGAAKKRVRLDTASCPEWIRLRLKAAGANVGSGGDPCTLPKARKNAVEIAGTRDAHVRDGAALTSFLAWLAAEAPKGGVTEISAVDRLFEFRRRDPGFRGNSFDTISGSGPNGAIVHYRVTPGTDRALTPGDVYLVDSGGQYRDGTTDVTRTVYIANGTGAPDDAREMNTRVLRGHIAIATARFPVGTSGTQLDALARLALWEAGADYDHGTGHGVGSYLGVHEGPQRISKQGPSVPLEPGMIVSNEPGYYRTDGFGIRIENLVVVRAAEMGGSAERDLLEFETLTLAPIDRALIEPSLMSAAELGWLNAYHARVRETVGPLVDDATRSWLAAATAPLQ